MNIVVKDERPPNYDAIAAKFKLSGGEIFAWDGIIYNPSKGSISPELIAHEKVHFKQQGGDPEAWWERYLEDAEFRFREELEAHRVEYAYYAAHHSRQQRRRYLSIISARLASPMYGNIVKKAEAKKLILETPKPMPSVQRLVKDALAAKKREDESLASLEAEKVADE